MNATYGGAWLLIGMVLVLAGLLSIPDSHAQDPDALRARQSTLIDQLANNQFQRPLVLESSQREGVLQSDAYAVVEHPYGAVAQALQGMNRLCDILMLHIDIKH